MYHDKWKTQDHKSIVLHSAPPSHVFGRDGDDDPCEKGPRVSSLSREETPKSDLPRPGVVSPFGFGSNPNAVGTRPGSRFLLNPNDVRVKGRHIPTDVVEAVDDDEVDACERSTNVRKRKGEGALGGEGGLACTHEARRG